MKKIILTVLSIMIVVSIIIVFYMGGSAGAYIWCLAVFILAPLASLLVVVQLINIVYRVVKKRSVGWNLMFILITAIYILPLTVMFGISPIVYPDLASENEIINAQSPIYQGIYLGGESYKTHAYWPSERYAYDVVKEPYDINSTNLEDYGIYGEQVTSPVYGTVIGVHNSEPDIPPNSTEFTSSLGNYVFIRVEDKGTYVILAHLKENSINVSVGEYIRMGQNIGLVGNSGTSSEPHLHMQHQRDNPLNILFAPAAEGLPMEIVYTECGNCD